MPSPNPPDANPPSPVGRTATTASNAIEAGRGASSRGARDVSEAPDLSKGGVTDRATGPASRAPGASGAAESRAPAAGGAAENRAPPAIRAAREAPLRQWFAYVWPAIALGGGPIGERGWVADAIGSELFRPVATGIARFLSAAAGSAARAAVGSTLASPPVAHEPQPALPETPAPAGGGGIAYFLFLAALLAVLAYTIWSEFRTALRTRPH